MQIPAFTIVLVSLFFLGCADGQQHATNNNAMTSFNFTPETADPDARALMQDEFFWSPIEESGPFGSDDGSDAAHGFVRWRQTNKNTSPVTYLGELIKGWKYPPFDWHEMDSAKISAYISTPYNTDGRSMEEQVQELRNVIESMGDSAMKKQSDAQLRETIIATSKSMGGTFLLGQDNAIIGTGFAQFVLEGQIDHDLKDLTATALKRQLLPLLINRYDTSYQETRQMQLQKMLYLITKAKS